MELTLAVTQSALVSAVNKSLGLAGAAISSAHDIENLARVWCSSLLGIKEDGWGKSVGPIEVTVQTMADSASTTYIRVSGTDGPDIIAAFQKLQEALA